MTALIPHQPQSSLARQPDAVSGFDLSEMRIFSRIPNHQDFGIVALAGEVAVFDGTALNIEGVVEGAFYVREHQRPACCGNWETWLRAEWAARSMFLGPQSPLTVRREVVKAIRWPDRDSWAVRLQGGTVDGPYYDWAWGTNFIGKVVGIYRPITVQA